MSVTPLILFGAFDRHNFGDLLLAQVAGQVFAGRKPRFAGLVGRDLREADGHCVCSLRSLAAEFAAGPVDLVHVGGELLGCSAFEAAVMLQPAAGLPPLLERFRRAPDAARAWVREELGSDSALPYLASRKIFAGARRWAYAGLGGVALDEADRAVRMEAAARLREAQFVWARDARTAANLASLGLATRLAPDPATLVAALFGARIRRRRAIAGGPRDYLALQFSAEFADDATLDAIASALARSWREPALAVKAFCAGRAPWHDDPALYARLARRLPAGLEFTRFASSRLWDLCALLAGARLCCASSLHAAIVADAFGVPTLGLEPGPGAGAKLATYADTWSVPGAVLACDAEALAAALSSALCRGRRELLEHARARARRAQAAWGDLAMALR